ncbi:MAG: aldolase catalytic domain-containing protein [Mucispirillum sp.]|nr:aldolase catalytic domain-containing protein [Mucispirillum sp.]
MKGEILLLDCTLRDGGFINNWEFGRNGIVNIADRLAYAGIDIVELGFLRELSGYDENRSEFASLENINGLIKKSAGVMLAAMIEFGTYGLNNIDILQDNAAVNSLRLMFRKNEIDDALNYAAALKTRGYEIFLQPVNIMDYSPDDILSLVHKANALKPFAFYIVDTYGFMNAEDLIKRFYLIDSVLKEDIKIGYHSHNNFQLAYSNSIELINKRGKRDIIIDASVFGMGKGAGNANTELIALYLNDNYGKEYNIDQLLEIADIYIEKEREKHFWGYTLLYYIAASERVHHQYVRYLINKKILSVKSIKEILRGLDESKKTSYDKEYIHKKYLEYQSVTINDKHAYEELKKLFKGRNILVLGLGFNAIKEIDKINEYIAAAEPIVIALNHIPDNIAADYIFIGNAKRYGQTVCKYKNMECRSLFKVIAVSNIFPSSLGIDFVLNYADLQTGEMEFDSSGIMLLLALIKAGVNKAALAGFDGFEGKSEDFCEKGYELAGDNAAKTEIFSKKLRELAKEIDISFITSSRYETAL